MKKCKVCKKEFAPFNTLQKVCSSKCAIEHVNKEKKKEIRRWQKKERERLKTKSDYLKEAQTAFNAYVRERDKHENCISCGRLPKKRNAGHYKSTGSSPELRFHEYNVHLQCEHCNTYKSGNQTEYRINLVRKIGARNVEWIEGPQQAQNLTIEDIKEIKQYYKDKLKWLKEQTNNENQ